MLYFPTMDVGTVYVVLIVSSCSKRPPDTFTYVIVSSRHYFISQSL